MTTNESKRKKIASFDSDGVLSASGNIFGLPFNLKESDIVLIPVPWDVTVSYKDGTSKAPEAIKKASLQLELYDPDYKNAWHAGFFMLDTDAEIVKLNNKNRSLAKKHIKELTENPKKNNTPDVSKINKASAFLNAEIFKKSSELMAQGKIAAVVGGDHSSPYGLIKALTHNYDFFSVLHIDAHSDLRKAYEGFTYSHASIMYNVLQHTQVNKIVQLGVRDMGMQEAKLIEKESKRIACFSDSYIYEKSLEGFSWKDIVNNIIEHLAPHVYISFDIDGLSPDLCPNTGTPVPGGLNFREITLLLKTLVANGRKIIGFDLCETGVSSNEWDENVSARILYKLCCATAVSQKLKKYKK